MNNAIDNYRTSLLGWNVFDEIFNSMPATWIKRTTEGYPVADIYRDDSGKTIMEFALAGFQKENLHVEVLAEKNEIHVSSDSHGDEESPGFNTRRIARRAFHKTYVNYDNNLDLSNVTAKYSDGLLRLEIPKKPESEHQRIEIE
tara:strand:- start:1131 stop:1562 length:432 start_codon:yes stop_codon:yes gene_type:complete